MHDEPNTRPQGPKLNHVRLSDLKKRWATASTELNEILDDNAIEKMSLHRK